MNTLKELRIHCIQVMKRYDAIADRVVDIYDVTLMECEDNGALEEYECEVAYSAIEDLIEEYLQNKHG